MNGRDDIEEGVWRFSGQDDGVPFLDWYTDEPGGGVVENCLAIISSFFPRHLHDVRCIHQATDHEVYAIYEL